MARDVDKIWEKHEIEFQICPCHQVSCHQPHLGLREDILSWIRVGNTE